MVILSDYEDSATTSSLKRKRSTSSLERKRSCNLHYYDHYDRYDVFLSFRGSDTRNTFTDHLYDHLKRAGISTFKDDCELESGESLNPQLEKAIKESSVSVIVFSEKYASSSWCLDELVRILEQHKIQGDHKVLPIFYRVDVADVRYQKGSYKEALNRHREKYYVGLDKINKWKAALTEAAGLSGFTLDSDKGGPETEFIRRIVCEVENSLPIRKTLDVPESLVGMNYRAIGIDLWLKDRSSDNNVLIICGIGGIGKTTIAKCFFNEYFRDFEGSCFLARIATMWNQIGVCRLQSQLLSTILDKREEVRIYNCDEGTEKIKRAICNRKVLLVLDDVSETEQLEALLGQPQRLCPGSKILVTTRNMSLKKDFTIPPKVHNVECLKDEDSLNLFSRHAFRQLLPPEEYTQITKEILLRCGCLPLALVILGSSLRKKLDIVFWKKQLQKWDEIGNPDVHKVMQISYNSLEDETVKNLFLHVACFFVGEEEDYVVKILDHCSLHATVGIQNLIDRCLITITTYGNKLMMHQVIQDMGREIVRQECPNEPGRRSRLWFHEDSFIVLKYDKGSEVVQGLILDGQKIIKAESDRPSFPAADANPHLITRLLDYLNKKKEEVHDRYLPSKKGEMRIDSFAKMVNLKLLKLNYVHLTGRCNKFPKELRWISWHGFPLEYVPMELPLKNLVAFDLQHSLLKQVWKGYMELKSLKFLNLSYSLELCRTPDFRGLPQLERLILRGCSNLVKVCETIGILKALLLLDFRDCKSLRDLPGLPQSLLTLELSGCSHLGEFPIEQRNVKPSDGYRVVKFASPNISTGPFKFLAHLPRFLVKLSLKGCNLSDESFPMYFSGLSSLEKLDLSGNLITRLPDCVRNLSNSRLWLLNVQNCPQLQSLIHPPSTVIDLHLENKKQLGKTKTRLKHKHFQLITDERTKHIENEGCFKLVKAGIVGRKVIKNLGLELVPIGCMGKVFYQFGIFSTYVKNTTRVPGCFKTYYTDGEDDSTGCIKVPFGERTKLQYTIPSSPVARKIQGLNICFIRRPGPLDCHIGLIVVTVCNKTKDLAWTYYYVIGSFELTWALEEHMWVCTWKCEDLWEAGDQIQVSFKILDPFWHEKLKVKECGIRIVYEEEEEEKDLSKSGLLWSDEMNVSFSNYRTPGTHYFIVGLFPDSYSNSSSNKEQTDGRAVQFVDWWGLNLNLRSKGERLRYTRGSPVTVVLADIELFIKYLMSNPLFVSDQPRVLLSFLLRPRPRVPFHKWKYVTVFQTFIPS